MSFQRQPDLTNIFVFLLIVGVEVHEVDSFVMRIVSLLNELQFDSNHVLMNYVETTTLSKSICYVHVGIYDWINKSVLLIQSN